jgi:hypothetical protein
VAEVTVTIIMEMVQLGLKIRVEEEVHQKRVVRES